MPRRLALIILLAACTPPQNSGGGGGSGAADAGQNTQDAGGEPVDQRLDPGQACDCSSDCWGTAANPGICVMGICMQAANGDCSEAGSRAECDDRSRCWGIDGIEGGICWPDADAYGCDGEVDGDGSCIPTEATGCDAECSDYCRDSQPTDRCADVTCGQGEVCDAATGDCIEMNQELPPGPVPNCAEEIPSFETCDRRGGDNACSELVTFDPRRAQGYWDYPLNGETESDQYRSFARRDLMLLIRRATAATECKSRDWAYQGYQDLGLGDMSEANGDIPGTREGQPGHPQGTHVNGHDMDIAYYQLGQRNNWLRPVCEHRQGGQDQYHCVGAPEILDIYRTALFIGHLHDSSRLRVIGVDGRVGPLVRNAIAQLCGAGWLNNGACRQLKLAYETEDEQRGWYYFHHHHLHISLGG